MMTARQILIPLTSRSRTKLRLPSAAWLDSRGNSAVASDTVITECGTIMINIALA